MTGIEKINKINEAVKTLRNHCVNVECSECVFRCCDSDGEEECLLMMEDMPAQWGDAEILTKKEKQALSFIPGKYKWIARDEDVDLCVYTHKPQKSVYTWQNYNGEFENLMVFKELFQFIQWEDEEPVSLDDLRKMCDE